VPKGTPKATIDALRDDVARATHTLDVSEKLAAQGAQAGTDTADQFGDFVRSETKRWTELIRASGIKAEQ